MSTFAQQAKRRTVFVMGSLAVLTIALVIRLIYLQVFSHEKLVDEAEKRLWVESSQNPWRGRIYDRGGRPLAMNEQGYVLWLDAKHYNGQDNVRALALLTRLAPQKMDLRQLDWILTEEEKEFGDDDPFFFLWARWLEPAEVKELRELMRDPEDPLQGVILEIEPRRAYPYGSLLAPILGYLVDEGEQAANKVAKYKAHTGIEAYYNDLLGGEEGVVFMEQDQQGRMIPIAPYEELPSQDGVHLTMTLDLNIQYMAERELLEAIDKVEAKRGDIVVMDPRNGAILAMASYPSFDPTKVPECAEDPICQEALYTNPIYGRQYEPGSTFKILTMAIALEEHVVRPDDAFECTGVVVVGDQLIHNWDGSSHGHETMPEILLHSCNIGAATLGLKIGPEAFYRYAERLGFGRPTGVDLTGEISGTIRYPDSPTWALSDLAVSSYGQAIAVTPLQLTAAVSAVANGGELMRPYILHSYGRDGVVTETLPMPQGRIFHEEICDEVTKMLVGIGNVKGKDNGPIIPGYEVAVKTGTAQIPGPNGYEPHRTIASAIGYAPAYEPEFVVLVRIEGNSVIWGEVVAIPVFARLSNFLLNYLQIPPSEGGLTAGQ